MVTVRPLMLLKTHNRCKVENLDCMGHAQKRMGKHLTNFKATTKGKLSHGKPISGQGRLAEDWIKCLPKVLWIGYQAKHFVQSKSSRERS